MIHSTWISTTENIEVITNDLYPYYHGCIGFDEATLPMKGKRKPNSHQEKRGMKELKRNCIPRKSLNYLTSLEVLPTFTQEWDMSSLYLKMEKDKKSA